MKKILLFLITILCSLNGWATEYTSGNLKYETEDHDKITYVIVKGLADGENPSSIEIPEQITRKISFQGISTTKTFKVYGVWSSAFKGNTNITSVTFPESKDFKYINASAFEGCTGLTSITIPSGIGQISGSNDNGLHKSAFKGCDNLTTVTINSQDLMTSSTSSIGVGDAFLNATTINMGDNVTSIGAYSFKRSASDLALTTFNFNNVTSIGNNAFENANKLTRVNLKNVETIGSDAFKGCTFQQVHFSKLTSDAGLPASVETYYIDELKPDRETYITDKDIILGSSYKSKLKISNTTVKKLVFGPNVENIWGEIIGSNSTERGALNIEEIECQYDGVGIGWFAFSDLTSLTTFTGKPGYINTSSFANCTRLTSIDLSLCTDISKNAFNKCSNLTINKSLGNVTNISDNAFFNCGKITAINSDKLTRIGQTAFKGCSMLTNVIAPNAYIAEGAFENCTKLVRADVKRFVSSSFGNTALKRLKFNDNSYTSYNKFDSESNIGTSIRVTVDTLEFGDDVTTIGDYAFCNYGVKVVAFNKVKTVGKEAFAECANLNCTGETITENREYYGGRWQTIIRLTNENKLNNIETLGEGAFKNCKALKEKYNWDPIELNKLTSIPKEAFYGCTALGYLKASNVTEIGESAFESCTSFNGGKSSFKEGATIGSRAFYNCAALEKTPVENPKTIGSLAFAYCTKLNSLFIEKTETIGGSAFEGCTGLTGTSLTLKNAIRIENNAFNNTGLVSVDLPNTLETLGAGAFPSVYQVTLNCPELLKKPYTEENNLLKCFGIAKGDATGHIEIGDDVTEIGSYAFYNNTYSSTGAVNVEHIRIGDGVTTLNTGAFYGLNATNYIYIGKALTLDKVYSNIWSQLMMTCENKVTIMTPSVNNVYLEKDKNWHTLFGKKVIEYEFGVGYGPRYIGGGAYYYVIPNNALYTEEKTALRRITFNINPAEDNPQITVLDDAVSGNANLEYIDLSNATIIGERSFKDCTKLKSVTIGTDEKDKGANSTNIQANAFIGCTGLSSIEIRAVNATVDATAFTGVKPFIMIDMSDQATLPSVNAGETMFITNKEARAKELRAEKIGGVRKYKYVTSVQRMGCEPTDVDMNGTTDGRDAQAIYDR